MGFLRPAPSFSATVNSTSVISNLDIELLNGDSYAIRGVWGIPSGEKRYGVIHTRPDGWVRSVGLNAWATGPAIIRATELDADFSGDVDNLTFLDAFLINRNRASDKTAESDTRTIVGLDNGDTYELDLDTADGGYFVLHHGIGDFTTNLNHNALDSEIQTALRTLYDNDNIDVSGYDGNFVITFDPLIGIARLSAVFDNLENAGNPSLTRTTTCIDDSGTILNIFPIGRFSLVGTHDHGIEYVYQLNKSYLIEAWNPGESDEDAVFVSIYGILNEGE